MLIYFDNVTFTDVASKHISDMTSSFKTKTEKFANEIQSDLKKRSKPILKRSTSKDGGTVTDGGDDPRTYKEESRVAQYGNFTTAIYSARVVWSKLQLPIDNVFINIKHSFLLSYTLIEEKIYSFKYFNNRRIFIST